MAATALDTELAYFRKHKSDLVKKYEGQFVVIKGSEVLGAFTTDVQAYEAGVTRFGNVPFLIQRICKEEEAIAYSPSLTTGLIHVRPQ
jgi:hypothetical protein